MPESPNHYEDATENIELQEGDTQLTAQDIAETIGRVEEIVQQEIITEEEALVETPHPMSVTVTEMEEFAATRAEVEKIHKKMEDIAAKTMSDVNKEMTVIYDLRQEMESLYRGTMSKIDNMWKDVQGAIRRINEIENGIRVQSEATQETIARVMEQLSATSTLEERLERRIAEKDALGPALTEVQQAELDRLKKIQAEIEDAKKTATQRSLHYTPSVPQASTASSYPPAARTSPYVGGTGFAYPTIKF
jgi:chromosome segregation ATPase